MKLEAGQVAVVTGAASGIGRALADAFAERGLIVAMVDVERSALDSACAEITATGGRAEAYLVDVRDPQQMDALAQSILATHGRVDVLVNNAGVITPRQPLWEQSYDDLLWCTEVNLYGVANGIRAFVPAMVQAGVGHVVNTSSLAGISTIPGGGNGIYSATKHGVVALSETLAVELADVAPEIGVTVLCPGPVPTNILTAERNRPFERPTPAEPATAMPDFGLVFERVPAPEVAQMVIRAIEERELYLVTSGDVAAMGLERVARVRASLEEQL